MLVRLQSQATTTPKIRAAIQACEDPARMLSERNGIREPSVLPIFVSAYQIIKDRPKPTELRRKPVC
jgi:hypothetical protein